MSRDLAKIAKYNPKDGLQADDDLHIRCPYCGHDHDDLSDHSDLVSYWGNDERTEFECDSCGQIFYVREEVRREFTSFKAEL
ncbi:hypothetical protein IAD21_00945 [Abditibacteriota bacterium]|nr:hypothetical protein IAD21_00945 [Abditibacteriota bacterium]